MFPMADDSSLEQRIEELRQDYARETGKPFKHFFCPILRVDESADMQRGHIVPESVGGRIWVPQRCDVDSFYGRAVEADFAAASSYRDYTLFEVLASSKLRQLYRPKIEAEGEVVGHYVKEESAAVSEQHTEARVLNDDGTTVCNLVIKLSSADLAKLEGKSVQLLVECDYGPVAIATAIKAAHLTLFRLMGYKYVMSPSGLYLSDILRSFFLAHRDTSQRDIGNPLAKHFEPHASMVAPVRLVDPLLIQGTISDNRVITSWDSNDRPFSIGVVIPAKPEMLTVFAPGNNATIDTYFSFLKNPPSSLNVTITEAVPETAEKEDHWSILRRDRIKLGQELPIADDQR